MPHKIYRPSEERKREIGQRLFDNLDGKISVCPPVAETCMQFCAKHTEWQYADISHPQTQCGLGKVWRK